MIKPFWEALVFGGQTNTSTIPGSELQHLHRVSERLFRARGKKRQIRIVGEIMSSYTQIIANTSFQILTSKLGILKNLGIWMMLHLLNVAGIHLEPQKGVISCSCPKTCSLTNRRAAATP